MFRTPRAISTTAGTMNRAASPETPGELMLALEHGIDTLKLFPAEVVGGKAMLKALYGPFADVRFCPTGGVSPSNAAEFLALPHVVCVGGSWLVPSDALARAVDRRAFLAATRHDHPRRGEAQDRRRHDPASPRTLRRRADPRPGRHQLGDRSADHAP